SSSTRPTPTRWATTLSTRPPTPGRGRRRVLPPRAPVRRPAVPGAGRGGGEPALGLLRPGQVRAPARGAVRGAGLVRAGARGQPGGVLPGLGPEVVRHPGRVGPPARGVGMVAGVPPAGRVVEVRRPRPRGPPADAGGTAPEGAGGGRGRVLRH